MIHSLLKGYTVVLEFPVEWEDMDVFQHVNNITYFRYFQKARIAYSMKTGLHKYKEETGIGPILRSASCRYKYPLTYPDTVSVGVKIVHLKEDRITMKYVVVSHRHQKIAAEGDSETVMYNYGTGKKTVFPEVLQQRLLAFEQR